MSPRARLAALGLCVALALALRLHQIGLAPFWMDEWATVWFMRLPVADLLGPVAGMEANPPGYYLLLHWLAPLTGEAEAGLRLPAAIAGSAAVLTTYAFTRRAFGQWAGLLAAFGLAVAAMHLKVSQEARNYALLYLLCSLGLLVLDRALAAAPGRARLVAILLGPGLIGAAMMHLHSTAAFAVAALHLYGLTRIALLRGPRLGPLLALVGAGLLTLVLSGWWLAIALEIARAPISSIRWIKRPDLHEFALTLGAGLVAPFIDARAWAAVALLAVLLTAAGWLAWRRRDARAAALLAAVLGGAVLFGGVSQVVPVLLDRTALVLLVFAMPLFGWVVATWPSRGVGAVFGLCFVVLSGTGIAEHYRTDALLGRQHTPWRHAVERIEELIGPDERAVTLGGFETLAFPAHAGDRLRATRPYLSLPQQDDRLGGYAADRMADVVRLDREGPCPDAAIQGLWTVGFQEAERSFIAPLMRRCGWVLLSDEPLSLLRIAHWRAMR